MSRGAERQPQPEHGNDYDDQYLPALSRRQFLTIASVSGGAVAVEVLSKRIFGMSPSLWSEAVGGFRNPLIGSPATMAEWLQSEYKLDPFLHNFTDRLLEEVGKRPVNTIEELFLKVDKLYFRTASRQIFRDRRDPIFDKLKAISQILWNVDGKDEAKRNFPALIGGNRQIVTRNGELSMPRWDTFMHFITNGLSSYTRFRDLSSRDRISRDLAIDFVDGIRAMIDIIGEDNFARVIGSLADPNRYPVAIFPNLMVDGLRGDEAIFLKRLVEMGVVFEILTSSTRGMLSNEREAISQIARSWPVDRIFNDGREIRQFIETILTTPPSPNIYAGLLDQDVTLDVLSNMLGVVFGIRASKTPSVLLSDMAIPLGRQLQEQGVAGLPRKINGVLVTSGGTRLVT